MVFEVRPQRPPDFPPDWVSDFGVGQQGYWIAFTYREVRCAFRWIHPGTFTMGSPEDEPERGPEDETQHQVTLTKGFWMAETACTQALWQAVMGENPSRFKGDQLPVENVSWNHCKAFIHRMNNLKPDLALRLPTEAEWEYACRAGTSTRFSFGGTITSGRANFNGNYPPKGSAKGPYREKTVDVKSLPPNAWGLYGMHGNVWEWCQDWYGNYPRNEVVDPKGPGGGEYRVLRGGSWFNSGRYVRSAYRYLRVPDSRNDYFGFRLSRG